MAVEMEIVSDILIHKHKADEEVAHLLDKKTEDFYPKDEKRVIDLNEFIKALIEIKSRRNIYSSTKL